MIEVCRSEYATVVASMSRDSRYSRHVLGPDTVWYDDDGGCVACCTTHSGSRFFVSKELFQKI